MINNAQDHAVFTDLHGLQRLKHEAKINQNQALSKVAKQFESIFIQMALKSMRAASKPLQSDLFSSTQMDFYQDMYDNQLSTQLAGKKLGLAELIEQQLSHDPKTKPTHTNLSSLHLNPAKNATMAANGISQETNSVKNTDPNTHSSVKQFFEEFKSKADFVKSLWKEAKQASEELGIHPAVLIAQAALETAWGRKIIKHRTGESSFNLFNIKASQSWNKDKVTVKTLEYKNGIVGYEHAAFRSYDSFSESFKDYIQLLKNNARYQSAIENANNPKKYLESLQAGGYATDPHYAKKIMNILDSDVFQSLF